MRLKVLAQQLAVCRLDAGAELSGLVPKGDFWSLTRTREEVSLVCAPEWVPCGARCEAGWRCLQVEGPLDFSLVGILAGLAGQLAAAGVSLFALSTFDTDYLLVKEASLPAALDALRAGGHTIA